MIATLPFDPAQQGVLFDAAEGMLLARDAGDDEVAGYKTDVSWILERGLATEQLDDREASQLARLIERCGPGYDRTAEAGVPERRRSSASSKSS
jgi:hypothetical protein